MEGVVRRFDLQRLDVLLRLNQRRLDPSVVGALRDLLRADTNEAHSTPVEHDATVQLMHVAAVLASWKILRVRLDEQAVAAPELDFLKERMAMLRSLVLQAGIDPEHVDALLEMAREESMVLSELQATLDELGWLMMDIANEIERRTVGLDAQLRGTLEELLVLLRVDGRQEMT
ncbi:MAG TPA: hypothetical protein DEQ40_14900 [Oxalobacteraceae bacterium]|jgi:hypothetical protein|nr:hypothetical protein [Oxalobacteraceae bacterium]